MSVANSASYGDQIAQGSIFVVFGWGLGPGSLVQAPAYPLGTQLGGTSVEATVNGTTLLCPMVYASDRQVAAILPSKIPTGEGTVRVIYSGVATYPSAINVVPAAFGIYTTSAAGAGPGSITTADYVLNTFASTVRPRDVAVLWGTGLGPAPSDDAAGPQPGVQFDGVTVFIGNQKAKLIYAGRSGGYAALDQINVEVPDVPDGCFVPVSVQTGTRMSNYVSMAVARSGGTCSNDSGVPADLLLSASAGSSIRVGAIALGPMPVLTGAGFSFAPYAAERISALLGTKVSAPDVAQIARALRHRDRNAVHRTLAKYNLASNTLSPKVLRRIRSVVKMDQLAAAAAFGEASGLTTGASQLGAFSPPSGTCTVVRSLPAWLGARSRSLDAGPSLTLSGPLGIHSLNRFSNSQYQVELGSGFAANVLPPGTYQIAGSGGPDIGPFTVSLTVGSSLEWSNKVAVSSNNIDRAQPLTVTWSGGAQTGHVLIGGSSQLAGSSAAFVCVEEARTGTFTIPAAVLSSLPPGDPADSYLFMAQHPLENRVTIPGLDLAYLSNGSSDYSAVTFR